jgi:hypothetical protein
MKQHHQFLKKKKQEKHFSVLHHFIYEPV